MSFVKFKQHLRNGEMIESDVLYENVGVVPVGPSDAAKSIVSFWLFFRHNMEHSSCNPRGRVASIFLRRCPSRCSEKVPICSPVFFFFLLRWPEQPKSSMFCPAVQNLTIEQISEGEENFGVIKTPLGGWVEGKQIIKKENNSCLKPDESNTLET